MNIETGNITINRNTDEDKNTLLNWPSANVL